MLATLYWKEELSPFLIVVPAAALAHWLSEFEKRCPTLHVIAYYGEANCRKLIERYELFHSTPPEDPYQLTKADIVIATDAAVRADPSPLYKVTGWEVMVVDETSLHRSGHLQSTHKRLAPLEVYHRILIAAAPLHTTVGEFSNMLNFLDSGAFKETEGSRNKVQSLSPEALQAMEPRLAKHIVERRLHTIPGVPSRKELVVTLPLHPEQIKAYRNIFEQNAPDMKIFYGWLKTNKTRARRSIPALQAILAHVRKACQHTYMADPESCDFRKLAQAPHEIFADILVKSSKFTFLHSLLPRLRKRGHRVLIFSHLFTALDLMQSFLTAIDYRYVRIDTSMGIKQRAAACEAFNRTDSEYFVCLLSSRCSELGLDLSSADTVIMLEPDFNHMTLTNAIATCHRPGQKRDVLVMTLVAESTAEEKVAEWVNQRRLATDRIVQWEEGEDARTETLEEALRCGFDFICGETNHPMPIGAMENDLDALLAQRGQAEWGSDGQRSLFCPADQWQSRAKPLRASIGDDPWSWLAARIGAEPIEESIKEVVQPEGPRNELYSSSGRKRKALHANLNENKVLASRQTPKPSSQQLKRSSSQQRAGSQEAKVDGSSSKKKSHGKGKKQAEAATPPAPAPKATGFASWPDDYKTAEMLAGFNSSVIQTLEGWADNGVVLSECLDFDMRPQISLTRVDSIAEQVGFSHVFIHAVCKVPEPEEDYEEELGDEEEEQMRSQVLSDHMWDIAYRIYQNIREAKAAKQAAKEAAIKRPDAGEDFDWVEWKKNVDVHEVDIISLAAETVLTETDPKRRQQRYEVVQAAVDRLQVDV